MSLAGPVTNWASSAKLWRCRGEGGGGGATAFERPDNPPSDPCPEFVRGVKLQWKFGTLPETPFDLAVEVNCEKVSVEVSGTVQGWIGAFGQIEYAPRSGAVTLFGGPKASGKIPGTSRGYGPLAIKGSESMDFSFVPVFGLAP